MIKLKKPFNFRRSRCNVLFFKRHSNLFLVLLDRRKRHVVTLTSGSCKLGKTKKQKISALNIGGLVKHLKVYLEKYKIKYVKLSLKQRIPFYYFNLKKMFKFHNIRIIWFRFLLCKKHGIKRGKNLRRI